MAEMTSLCRRLALGPAPCTTAQLPLRARPQSTQLGIPARPVTVASSSEGSAGAQPGTASRREALQASGAAALSLLMGLGGPQEAHAMLGNRRAMREQQIPEEAYTTLPSGLKVYEIKVGGGKLAEKGDRVTIHYVVKWNGVTFMTSRQGAGVTGGTPYGFDLGSSDIGYVLKGLDLAVEGMRVGGQRQVICPPELAYGNKGLQEIPPGATLEINIELLSIKESPFGYQVKLVEG